MKDNNKYNTPENLIDDVLKTEPQFLLSENFAEKIVEKADNWYVWMQYLKEFLIYIGVLVGIGVLLFSTGVIWYKADIKELAGFLETNISWVIGANIILLFVFFTDRVLLRYMFHRTTAKN